MKNIKVIVNMSYVYYRGKCFTRSIKIQLPQSSRIEDLIINLKGHYPDLEFNHLSTLVNNHLVYKNVKLYEGDRILLLPILSGG